MINTEKIADSLTNYIVENKVIKKEESEIYKYGFWTGIEMLIYIITCCCIAAQMDMFQECVVFFLVFFSLRSFVGGIHMSNYRTCFVCSCIVFILILLAVDNVKLTDIVALSISSFELLLIFFMSPVEHINRPVDKNEKKVFAYRIKQILAIILGTVIFLFMKGYNNYLSTITYTLGIIIISMLLGKIKMREEDGGMTEREGSFD